MLIGCVGEDEPLPDGPLRENDLARVKTVGAELIEGFEWDTVDLTDDQQVFLSFFPLKVCLEFLWGSRSGRSTSYSAITTLRITKPCSDSTTLRPSCIGHSRLRVGSKTGMSACV